MYTQLVKKMALAPRAWCSKPLAQIYDQRRESKSVNPFLEFFFSVNYALGGVILALPYSFLHAGLLIAIPTMLAVAFVGWINATWVLEVMARAQVGVAKLIQFTAKFIQYWL